MKSFKFCLWLIVCLFTLCLSFNAMAASTDTQSFFDDLIRQEQGGANNASGSNTPAAPACDGGAGCTHLTVNEKGEMVGICALGRWYMSVDNSGMLLRASAPEDLTLVNGNNYIFRSTTYNLSGGGDSAAIYVKDGLSPLFIMGQATVDTLYLLAGASATLSPGAKINVLKAAGGTLNVYGNLSFDSIDDSLKVTGDGVVRVVDLKAELSAASDGNCRILYTTLGPSAVKNWRQVTLSSGTFPVTLEGATYNGIDLPICFEATGNSDVAYVPLSTDPQNNYSVELADNGTRAVIKLEPQVKTFTIANASAPLIIDGGGVLTGNGNQNVQVNANAVLQVSSASTTGSFTVSSGCAATLTLYGSNRFGTLNVQGTNARIGGMGALRVQTIQGSDSITIDSQTNFSVANAPSEINGFKPNKITIKESGKPVTNTRIMLKIGTGKSFVTTTDENGCVTLWRPDKLDKVSAVALSGGGTYVAMLSDGSGEADALPVITSLTADRRGNVTVKANNAKTLGLQYHVGSAEQAMPDAFDSSATHLYTNSNGHFLIPGLKHGDVVTLRAFAARDTNVTLNAGTNDAFIFSKQLVVTISTKNPFTIKPQEKTYDGAAFAFDSSKVNPQWDIKYYSNKQPNKAIAAPVNAGHYFAVITIPDTDPAYIPGEYKVEIDIKTLRVYIYPDQNMKIKGEHDPYLGFEPRILLGGDEAHGRLTRMEGEEYGNYPYYADKIYALNSNGERVYNYSFVIAPESGYFFIDWNRSHYMYLDPLAIINPVFDELQLGNGRVLKVQTRTDDELSMNGVSFGSLVIDTETQHARPFTPSLRLRQGVDQALIILTAEAELSKDGGYQTDRDGNREWRSRTLTLSPYQINHFKALYIQDVAFSLRDTAVMFSLEDLTNEQIEQRRKDNDMLKLGIRYCFELTPLTSTAGLDADEGAAIPALAERQPLMRVRAYMENDGKQVDISDLLTSAQLLFDASGLMTTGQAEQNVPQDVTETVNGRPVQPKADDDSQKDAAISALLGQTEDTQLLDLGSRLLGDEIRRKGYALRRYSDDAANALSSTIIVPYTASERAIPYAAVLRIRPYLITPFNLSSLYGLTPDEAATSKR